MSEQKFNNARGDLAFSQQLRDKLMSPPQAQSPQVAQETPQPQPQDQSKMMVEMLKSIEQQIGELGQRLDVLEQQSGTQVG